MNGPSWHAVAAVLNDTNVDTATIRGADARYRQIYERGTIINHEFQTESNYRVNRRIRGNAIYEISTGAWGADRTWLSLGWSEFPASHHPVMTRGGDWERSTWER